MPSEPKVICRIPRCACGCEETVLEVAWKEHYGVDKAPDNLHVEVTHVALNDKSQQVNTLLVSIPYLINNWDICAGCGVKRVTSSFIQVYTAVEIAAAQAQLKQQMLGQMNRS